MDNVIYATAAISAWIAVVYKIRALRHDRRNPMLRAVAWALICPAVAFTLATPAVFNELARLLPLHNLGKTVEYGSLIMFSFMVQRMLLIMDVGPEAAAPYVRRRFIGFASALAALVVLLSLSPVPAAGTDFTVDYVLRSHYVPAVLLLYSGALVVGLFEIGRLCWRYSRSAGRPWLVRGLRITAAGAFIALPYSLLKITYVVGRLAGARWDVLETLEPFFAALGAVLVFIGLTIPTWGDRVSSALLWPETVRIHVRIYPVWLAVYRTCPQVVLERPVSTRRGRFSLSRISDRVYRKIIEIHDARLAVRPYLDTQVRDAAIDAARSADLTDEQRAAVVEACLLRVALTAFAAQRPTPAVPVEETAEAEVVANNARAEGRYFARVAAAWNSPIVNDVVALFSEESSPTPQVSA